jgi:signal peptidase I
MNWINFLKPNKKKIIMFFILTIFNYFLLSSSFLYISQSMEPTINKFDLVFYGKINFEDLKVGDIILFKAPDRPNLMCHRIISIENEVLRTKGDNNLSPDPEIWKTGPDDVIGKIAFTLPCPNIFYPSFDPIILLIYRIFSFYILSCIIIWIYERGKS